MCSSEQRTVAPKAVGPRSISHSPAVRADIFCLCLSKQHCESRGDRISITGGRARPRIPTAPVRRVDASTRSHQSFHQAHHEVIVVLQRQLLRPSGGRIPVADRTGEEGPAPYDKRASIPCLDKCQPRTPRLRARLLYKEHKELTGLGRDDPDLAFCPSRGPRPRPWSSPALPTWPIPLFGKHPIPLNRRSTVGVGERRLIATKGGH